MGAVVKNTNSKISDVINISLIVLVLLLFLFTVIVLPIAMNQYREQTDNTVISANQTETTIIQDTE